jgi:hypothetical protein
VGAGPGRGVVDGFIAWEVGGNDHNRTLAMLLERQSCS